MTPFEILTIITLTKKLPPAEDIQGSYVPYLINRGLSFYPDTVFHANYMNGSHWVPKVQQFDFFVNSIPSRKRFAKWAKKLKEDENLELIKQYFGYNNEKARKALSLLNEQQIEQIKQEFIQGGPENDK